MTRKPVDNPFRNKSCTGGFGFVAAVCEGILQEQAAFAAGLESRDMDTLPPRTPDQERDMSWDDGMMNEDRTR